MNFDSLTIEMGKYAQSQYPYEACGIITKTFSFIPSKNLSKRPRQSFMLDPLLMLDYDKNIWGIFHSHVDDRFVEPSSEDLQMCIYENLKFILGVNDKFYIYWYDKDKDIKRYEHFEESHCKNI
jgi:Predicted metal-dependent protease of the PAD1/JAB1 superfamily